MADAEEAKQHDWVIDPDTPPPTVSPEALESLQELAALIAGHKTFEDLLPASQHINSLVRVAVTGGATAHHVGVNLGLDLRRAQLLIEGRSFDQLFTES